MSLFFIPLDYQYSRFGSFDQGWVGKLSLSNAPERLNVYMISKEIMSR
ncbi:MAG: hypothetical protein ACTSWX_16065 [Promethearchaeota archaeon]